MLLSTFSVPTNSATAAPAATDDSVPVESRRPSAFTIPNAEGGSFAWGESGPPAVVLHAAAAENPFMFEASKWAPPGTVSASGVNALHISLMQLRQDGQPFGSVGISIVPRGMRTAPHEIELDMEAGTGLFGAQAPPLFSPVRVVRDGDRITAVGIEPAARPDYILRIDQRAGRVDFWNDGWQAAGSVLKPVTGTGRFEGSQWCPPGRVRATHPGVICVSTSPLGKVGGFQVIPEDHARSPNLAYTWETGAYLIVRSPDGGTAGSPPLFGGIVAPMDRVWIEDGAGRCIPLPEQAGLGLLAVDTLLVTNLESTEEVERWLVQAVPQAAEPGS